MNFRPNPESFRGGKYNPNVFEPGRNGILRDGLIRLLQMRLGFSIKEQCPPNQNV
jgi:hypothetical protein